MAERDGDDDMVVAHRLGQSLLDIVHEIGNLSRSSSSQSDTLFFFFKKDYTDLTRRVSLLSHLFEEIKESSCRSSSSSSSSLGNLLLVLQDAKRLLVVAGKSDSDNTILDDNGKKVTCEFQRVTWLLERTLRNFPYNHFDISDEVREQIDLVMAQLRRAVERYGPLSSRVVLLSHQLVDQKKSVVDVESSSSSSSSRVLLNNLFPTVGNRDLDYSQTMVHHDLPKAKDKRCEPKVLKNDHLSSTSIRAASDKLMEADTNRAEKYLANKQNSSDETKKQTESVVVPDDFRCPISLELMRDPVIVSTGQTYERSCIQRWIDCGNKTCPKTQQMLSTLTLTPNYVLRSVITQWCEKHKIDQQPTGTINGRIRKSDGSSFPELQVGSEMAAINALVRKLLSRSSVEERRRAASEIRSLSKRSTDNRILIAEAGAIPVLVNLLTIDDARIQEHAVTSILNLSIYESNKGLIILAGAVPSIVQVLRMGSMEARENAAATLFSLSLLDENKITIGASGAIPALVELLKQGSSRGKKDAATALFNLCIYQGNKGRAIRAGILVPLMKMLTDSSGGCLVDEALTILSVLACHQEGKVAISKASIIPVLIDLIRTGQPRNKENSAAILLSVCKKDADNLECIGRLGAVIPLTELTKSGTERAKRKATSLLEYLRKLEQL